MAGGVSTSGIKTPGIAKKLIEKYSWWKFEPHPEWVEPHRTKEDYIRPYAAGIPGEVRVVFIPHIWDAIKIVGIESGVSYQAYFFNPSTANEYRLGRIVPDPTGIWEAPFTPTVGDWILVLEA